MAGGLIAAAVAFAPSFSFILLGADRFTRLLADETVRAFIDGAAPAALGAILGSAVPLALALQEPWQIGVLVAAAGALIVLRRGIVVTLVACGAAGVLAVLLGAHVPS
jgi:chromate transporter